VKAISAKWRNRHQVVVGNGHVEHGDDKDIPLDDTISQH